jgi:cell division protein ZapD
MQVLTDNPAVDSSKLTYFINQLNKLSAVLNSEGRAGDILKTDPFLTIVRQKWSLGGALCSFDAPQIIQFLGRGTKHTQQRLQHWMGLIKVYKTSVGIILRLYRESGEFTQCITQNLSFQENIDAKIKLIAIKLPQNVEYVPEVSIGSHRLSLLLTPLDGNPTKNDMEIQFSLAHYRA